MPLNDPPRLLDPGAGTHDVVRRALDAARADLPPAHRLARLAAQLPSVDATSGPGADTSAASGGAAKAPFAPTVSALPGAIVGAVLGLVAVGLHALITGPDPGPIAAQRAPPALVASASAGAAPGEATRTGDPDAPRPADAPGHAAAPTPTAISAGSGAWAADPTTAASPAGRTGTASPPAEASSEGAGSQAGAEPRVADAETEIELLQRAQDALGGSPARALELVDRHAARFPGSGLGQEREVIAIDALVRLGRHSEAEARALAFVARFPRSAHVPRLQAMMPGKKIDGDLHKAPDDSAPTGR